jgi:hypothetical protein
MTEDERDLTQKRDLGEAFIKFLRSKHGKHVSATIEARRTAALEALVKVNPEDAEAIRATQNKVLVYDEFFQILTDAVTEGAQAAQILSSAPE